MKSNNIHTKNLDKRIFKTKKMHSFKIQRDVWVYIVSEFLYTKDWIKFFEAHRCFCVEPYKYNFKTNKINLIHLKQREQQLKLVPIYYFELFELANAKSLVFQKLKIKHLTTTQKFNKKLEYCIQNIEESEIETIEFGAKYNKILPEKLPPTLKHIEFGQSFNQLIETPLPKSIETIIFGFEYEMDIEHDLPGSLKHLEFGTRYDKPIQKKLPSTLVHLIFGHYYNQPLPQDLPGSLKYIEFKGAYNQPLPEKLPESLVEIKFGYNFNQPFKNQFPKSVKKITLSSRYDHNIAQELIAPTTKILYEKMSRTMFVFECFN